MIDEHEITRKAYEQKAQIIETANEMAREINRGTKEYADDILETVEGRIREVQETLAKTIAETDIILDETQKKIKKDRSELK